MPLIQGKSPKAFKSNLKAEMAAGKPQKQALAIAYSVKRKAQHKAHGGDCYAIGGEIDPKGAHQNVKPMAPMSSLMHASEGGEMPDDMGQISLKDHHAIVSAIMAQHKADGGEIDDDEDDMEVANVSPLDEWSDHEDSEDKEQSILDRIMHRARMGR
jgi:hypothetical protein